MNDFFNTIGGRKLCDHTIPELIRKLDKVSALDFDGLTKAMNRLAKAQEEANRIARSNTKDLPEVRDAKMEAWKRDFLSNLMSQLNKADASGLVLRDADLDTFTSARHLLDDFPIAYSFEGDWCRVWKVGISDNEAEREVAQIIKCMWESEKDTLPCGGEIAKLIRDNERVRCKLASQGVKIDDNDGVLVLTKLVATMSDAAISNFVESIVSELKHGQSDGITVRGKSYRAVRDNDKLRTILMGRGVKIEHDEDDESIDLTLGDGE